MKFANFMLNTVVAQIFFGGYFLAATIVVFPDSFVGMRGAFVPAETAIGSTIVYQLMMTACIVWLFGKSVGSGNLKEAAIFGIVIGFLLMAADAYWFDNLINFPQDGRCILAGILVSAGVLMGLLLAFMHRKGWGWHDRCAAAEPGCNADDTEDWRYEE